MKRSLLGGFTSLAVCFACIAPAAAPAQTPAPSRPYLWVSEHDGPYSWLIAYPATALRAGTANVAPAATIVVPGFALDDVTTDARGDVYAKYAPLTENFNGFLMFGPGSQGAAVPTNVSLGQRRIQSLASDPEGNAFAILAGVQAGPGGPAPTAIVVSPSNKRYPQVAYTPYAPDLTQPDGMALYGVGSPIVAEANHPEPPLNTVFIFLAKPGMSPQALWSFQGSVGGVAFDRQGNLYALIAPAGGSPQLLQFLASGGYHTQGTPRSLGRSFVPLPNSLAIDTDGYAYVLAPDRHVLVFTPPSLDRRLVNDWVCCPDDSIPVAPGLRSPRGGPTSIAVEH